MKFSVLLDCLPFSFEQNIDERSENMHFVQEKLTLRLTIYPELASTDRILNNPVEALNPQVAAKKKTDRGNVFFSLFSFRVDGKHFENGAY